VIDILIPSLGRAEKLIPLLDNINETTPEPHSVVFVLDEGDQESQEVVMGYGKPGTWAYIVLQDGTLPVKTNAGYHFGEGEFVLATGDDVVFHPGWLEAALAVFEDPTVCLVGGDDLSPATADRTHATMPILRRSYCEDPGAAFGERNSIFHEGYTHNFVETETCHLAQHRGVWGWAEDCVIEHCHPAWGKRDEDDTDRKGNQQGWEQDEALFHQRQRQWLRSR
jgi:glycosyltransferase involved in cell wall biosynthesis